MATGGAAVGAIVPTTLDQESGWGGKQILILLVILFTLGLVFVPAYAWRRLSEKQAAALAADAPVVQSALQQQAAV